MKPRTLCLFACLLVLGGSLAAAQDGASGEEQEIRALVRVDGDAGSEPAGSGALGRLIGSQFDPGAWRLRLVDADLDAREKAYAELVLRARLDPSARLFVEEIASDPSDLELSWTGRLALRELGAARFQLLGIGPEAEAFQLQLETIYRNLAGESPSLPFRVPRPVDRFRLDPGATLAEPSPSTRPDGDPGTLDPSRLFVGSRLVPVRTDVLGVVVEPIPKVRAERLGLDFGLHVLALEPGTLADRLGVRTSDILVELNGVTLRRPQDITDVMHARDRMSTVTVVWFDDLNLPVRASWKPDVVPTGPSPEGTRGKAGDEPPPVKSRKAGESGEGGGA